MKKLYILFAILPIALVTLFINTSEAYAYYVDGYILEIVTSEGSGTSSDRTVGTNLYTVYTDLTIKDTQLSTGSPLFENLYTLLSNYATASASDYSGILLMPDNKTLVNFFGNYYETNYIIINYTRSNDTMYLGFYDRLGNQTFYFSETTNQGLDLFNFLTLKTARDEQAIVDAYEQGYALGENRGYGDGYAQGLQDGLDSDTQESYDKGYNKGYADGGRDSFLGSFEKWIVPAIISVIFIGGAVSLVVAKRRGDN